jgi:peptidoglycan biosynthesis protein MviN/MurJ (putative lipid II flippase)
MGNPVPDSKTPVYVAFIMVVVGIVIAAVQGITHGSMVGGVIAAAGAIPACYGMWKGIQQETQGTLALSVTAVLVSLVIGGLLIVLRVVSWLH